MTNMAPHPNLDPEFLQGLADSPLREALAEAIAQFPALHRTWEIEALESTRGRYALANHIIDAIRQHGARPTKAAASPAETKEPT